ncbi:hypothetical protein EW146_g439 [Bondarzewia mesenterica]|uniref:A to I editase domain-containing protein n=1 Tax=Bondarzewia mesenterica TaxID=1095465 RepID=A0A4S4M8W2_9AGAM|nr:hypothetical protein EW146_g439 [Bondarzewia mesenterica]
MPILNDLEKWVLGIPERQREEMARRAAEAERIREAERRWKRQLKEAEERAAEAYEERMDLKRTRENRTYPLGSCQVCGEKSNAPNAVHVRVRFEDATAAKWMTSIPAVNIPISATARLVGLARTKSSLSTARRAASRSARTIQIWSIARGPSSSKVRSRRYTIQSPSDARPVTTTNQSTCRTAATNVVQRGIIALLKATVWTASGTAYIALSIQMTNFNGGALGGDEEDERPDDNGDFDKSKPESKPKAITFREFRCGCEWTERMCQPCLKDMKDMNSCEQCYKAMCDDCLHYDHCGECEQDVQICELCVGDRKECPRCSMPLDSAIEAMAFEAMYGEDETDYGFMSDRRWHETCSLKNRARRHRTMSCDETDSVVSASLDAYASLSISPQPGKFTILAAFVLFSPTSRNVQVISLGTGSKCLPTTRLPPHGDALHDCHAEVIARRGAVRWFLEEARRDASSSSGSEWIARGEDGCFALRDDVHLYLYVSTVPCGDASTGLLASAQDPYIASLKDSTPWPPLPLDVPSRGRDNYARVGVLRTKPGRADAPAVLSMSCSDKIALWSVVGIQGALASGIFRPVYVHGIIMGEVDVEMRATVREECERAFYDRIGELKALCWIADTGKLPEVLINGLRRGVPPKHRFNDKFRPLLSKISLYTLYRSTLEACDLPVPLETATYYTVKQSITHYQMAKRALLGAGAPFANWIRSGAKWESFDARGVLVPPVSDTGHQ